jgi:hypothetical protein
MMLPEEKKKNSFTNYHLAISREQFAAARQSGLYEESPLQELGLNIRKIDNPDYTTFSSLIDRVGEPWGWTQRPRYHRTHHDDIEEMLKHPQTELYLLRKDEETLGYCLVTAGKTQFNGAFPGSAKIEQSFRLIIEIENFGLFPEHTGKGYGRFFLPLLFENLLERYNVVYLSSRSTNHKRVVPFYENLGMRILYTEDLPDDLLPDEKPVPRLPKPLSFFPQ